jgi:Undecaprenyl-phosphate galactose phosphotransferase WbaP
MRVVKEQKIERLQAGAGRRRALLYHRKWLTNALVMGFGDGLALVLAMMTASALRWWLKGDPMFQEWFLMLPLGWWGAASVARLLPSWGMGIVEELRRVVILLGLLFAGTLVVLFLTKQSTETSRFTLSIGFVGSLALVPFVRTRVKRALISRGRWGVPAVVYGAGETGRMVLRSLREEPGIGYVPIGVFDDDPELWGDYTEAIPILGSTAQSADAAPVAILAMPGIPRTRMIELLEGPLSHYQQVVIIPDLFDIPTLWVRSRNLAGILGLEITHKLLDPVAQFMKRTMDVVCVLATAPVWGPLYGLIAGAVWFEDRQSPFFYQERVGKKGRVFRMRKFRTMVPDAEAVLNERLAEDPALRLEWETTFKLRDDPRLTRIGAFLRRTSLDEIPQLINVLRGEMSLVGPRPLPAYHQAELPARVQQLRTNVRPGMTGLWQVSGRSDVGNEGLVRWDAYYVRNWSIWLDIVILVRTVRVVFRGSGAY